MVIGPGGLLGSAAVVGSTLEHGCWVCVVSTTSVRYWTCSAVFPLGSR